LLFSVYLFYVVAIFAGAYDGFGLAGQHAGRGSTHLAPSGCRVHRNVDGVEPDDEQTQQEHGVGDGARRQVSVVRVSAVQR